MEKICVAVRMRPSKVEESPGAGEGTNWRWKLEDNRVSLCKLYGTPVSSGASFAFDHVFDEKCTNSEVYELLTKDVIHAAVQGFNGTAFAYGQTSSGKTFTMNGSENDPGIILRAIKDVFQKIEMTREREYFIRVSYMEIYNEEINDLLSVENQKLPIHESLEQGIFVAGLREEIVSNAEQVFQLLKLGEVNRHFGETNMNARSSRSHTIFRMVIESKGRAGNAVDDYCGSDAIRVSVLNLVDLAGSERIAKTGAGGVRLKEGKYINKSLMVLGNVINKLSDNSKQRGHIPYRDSKLTRILQPALGGNAKTSIICTLAPEEVHVEETKGTLQFASRAKRVTNCAQVNEILTDAALVKRQQIEIEELRLSLRGSRAEVLEQEVQKLRNEMLKCKQDREKLEVELEEERRSQKERQKCIPSDMTYNESSGNQNFNENLCDGSVLCQDVFQNPCFQTLPNALVVSRTARTARNMQSDCSSLPDSLTNIADEDTWQRMNNGYIADLDMLEMTPLSFNGNYGSELERLKGELGSIKSEKIELQKIQQELSQRNALLIDKIAELEQAITLQDTPKMMSESVSRCKEMFNLFRSSLQRSVHNAESPAAKLLSGATEFGMILLSDLEAHFSASLNSHTSLPWNDSMLQEQCKTVTETLQDIIKSMQVKVVTTWISKRCAKDCIIEETTEDPTRHQLHQIKNQFNWLEKNWHSSNNLLEISRQQCDSLERELQQLRKKRSTKLQIDPDEKETEAHRRHIRVQDEIQRVALAFSNRHKSHKTLRNKLRTVVEKLAETNPISLSQCS